MPSKKPTLGYSSRTDAVRALRDEGLDKKEIANRIGISPKDVAALEASAARTGLERSPRVGPMGMSVLFPPELCREARCHAVARDISVVELFKRLVEAAVEDGLVDALLDDAPLKQTVHQLQEAAQ